MVATLYMDTGVQLAACLHAGQQPDKAERVGIAHQGWQFRYSGDIYPALFRLGRKWRSTPAGGYDCAVDIAK